MPGGPLDYRDYGMRSRLGGCRPVRDKHPLSVFKDNVSALSKAMTAGCISKLAARTPRVSVRPTSSAGYQKASRVKGQIIYDSLALCGPLPLSSAEVQNGVIYFDRQRHSL
jgi:hypothetical protein